VVRSGVQPRGVRPQYSPPRTAFFTADDVEGGAGPSPSSAVASASRTKRQATAPSFSTVADHTKCKWSGGRSAGGGGGATNRGAVGRDGLAAPVAGAIVAGSSSSPAPGTTGAGRPEVERGGVEASPIPAAARVSARLGRRAAGAWPSGPAAEAPATNAATAWFEPPRRGARAELCSAGEEARGREDIVPPMSTLHGLVSPHRPRLRPCLCPPPTPLPLSSPPFPYSVSSPRKMVLSADPLAMTGSVG